MSEPVTYPGYRFPAAIIGHAVWLYHVFGLSLRDVELILAERGITVTHESIRQWGLKFGGDFARKLRRRRPKPGRRSQAVWARAAKRVTRVLARGSPSSQWTTRETFIPTAMQTCWSAVFASPT